MTFLAIIAATSCRLVRSIDLWKFNIYVELFLSSEK